MSAILFFLPLFRAQAPRFALALLLSIVALAAGAALLGTSGWFITAAAVSAAGVSFNIFGPSALVRGFSFIRILSRYGERLVGHDATLRLLSDIRTWLFGRLFPLVPFAPSAVRHGDLVSRLVADVEALDTVLLVSVAPVVAALVTGSAVTTLLVIFLPQAAAFYGTGVLVAVIAVPALFLGLSRRPGAAVASGSAALRTTALSGIEGHRDLMAAGALEWAAQTLSADATRLSEARRRLGDTVVVASATVQLVAGMSLVAVLWFGLAAVHEGRLDGALLVGLLLAVVGSFEATAVVVRSVGRLGIAAAAATRLKGLATQAPAILDTAAQGALPAGGSLVFEGVRFGYGPDRPILTGLDLSVPGGSRIAIIGPSGSGKSTILSLLLRLRDPLAGTVSIAGVDLRRVPLAEVHRHVALLGQDAPVFMDSIANNLRIGRPEASDAELWQALEAARIGTFVAALPDGLDTFLGESGRTLSAGQARRLCLARTLLSPAGIIVLDEPTSGLDAETETAFLADLATATAGRTVVLATHAQLPAGAVDRLYRLVGGRLVDAASAGEVPASPA